MRRRSRAITLRNRFFLAKRPSYAEWPSVATAESQRWSLARTTVRCGRQRKYRSQGQKFPGVSGAMSGPQNELANRDLWFAPQMAKANCRSANTAIRYLTAPRDCTAYAPML